MSQFLTADVQKILNHLNSVQSRVERVSETIVRELVDRGSQSANRAFNTAIYDGKNDVLVVPEQSGKQGSVVARGKAVAFIEFGTGVWYKQPTHPLSASRGMIRGSFGYRMGRFSTWYYKGNPGSNGRRIGGKNKFAGYIQTHGNPANMCLWDAAKYMRNIEHSVATEAMKNG